MMIYARLGVSDKATHICVVEGDGAILCRGAQLIVCFRN